jgi:hypothetical protein
MILGRTGHVDPVLATLMPVVGYRQTTILNELTVRWASVTAAEIGGSLMESAERFPISAPWKAALRTVSERTPESERGAPNRQ